MRIGSRGWPRAPGYALVSLALLLIPSAAAATQLLPNPGFESDKTGWNFPSNGRIDKTIRRSGAKSAKLVNLGKILTKHIPVSAGQRYQYAGWVKLSNLTNPNNFGGARLQLHWYKASGSLLSTVTLVERLRGTQDWRRYAGAFTAPSTAASVGVCLEVSGAKTTGTAWFDDMEFSPANQPPVLSPIGSQTIREGQLLQFTVSATDPEGNPLTVSVSPLPAGATFHAAIRVFAWTPAAGQAGSHSVTFTVSDGLAAASERVTLTVTANQLPVLMLRPMPHCPSGSPSS